MNGPPNSLVRAGAGTRVGIAPGAPARPTLLLALALLALGGPLLLAAPGAAWIGWAVDVPQWLVVPAAEHIGRAVRWLSRDAAIGSIEVSTMSRGVAWLVEQPMELLQGLLADGFVYARSVEDRITLPPLPWLGLALCAIVFGHWADGRRGALQAGGVTLYLALFGLWEPGMLTFASVVVAVILGAVLGTSLGVAAHLSRTARAVLFPLYDVMQTLPVFSYLVPAILFFGFGPVSALIATVIYAMPPMARVTTLALDRVPEHIVELGRMTGCSRRQQIFMVLLPAAGQGLRIGLNQLILLTLAMVIIASIIGAGGLGADVLKGLKSLKLAEAVEAGLAITLMAICFDRLSLALADRRPQHRDDGTRAWPRRHPHLLAAAAALAGSLAVAPFLPAVQAVPAAWTFSTGALWNDLVTWINLNLYEYIRAVKDFTILNLMRPTKDAFLALPWLGVVVAAALAGYGLRGARTAVLIAALLTLIALSGYWDQAMVSLYLVSLAVLLAVAIGLPLGIWAALSPGFDRLVTLVIDTLQTMPTFVYLIPVVMILGTGEFPALVAIVLYAVPPAVRYTKEGIKAVDVSVLEAAVMAGCRRRQVLSKVQLPLALPDIMLGINQTIMIAFSMLVITALVGTRGLEQETLIAIGKVRPGEGLVAGLGIAFLSIVTDRLVRGMSDRLRQRLGITA